MEHAEEQSAFFDGEPDCGGSRWPLPGAASATLVVVEKESARARGRGEGGEREREREGRKEGKNAKDLQKPAASIIGHGIVILLLTKTCHTTRSLVTSSRVSPPLVADFHQS